MVSFSHPSKQGEYYTSTCNDIWPGDGGCKGGNGESDTGVLQSDVFEIAEPFLTFRVAGYNGQDCGRRSSFVRLRHAETHEALRVTKVPCQNPLKPEFWEVGDLLGQTAYVEVEDGDAADSWAWTAVDDLRR